MPAFVDEQQHGDSIPAWSEQLPLPCRFLQALSLVEQALHELLFLVSIREDFADVLGDQPGRRIGGMAATTEDLGHAGKCT